MLHPWHLAVWTPNHERHPRQTSQEPKLNVRVFCDWGADTPLWLDGAIDPESLGITEPLASRLRQWRRAWDGPPVEERLPTEDSFLLEGWRLVHLLNELGLPDLTFIAAFDDQVLDIPRATH